MNKTKLAMLSVAALFSFGAATFVSADETVSEPSQVQEVSIEQKKFDTSNILSVFFDGKDTHVTLTNGENWTLENYEGKFGEFEMTSQLAPSRLRAVPTSKYLTATWSGYGNSPSSMYVSRIFTYNDAAYGGLVQALFQGNIPRISASQGTARGQSATYGGNVPRVGLRPA